MSRNHGLALALLAMFSAAGSAFGDDIIVGSGRWTRTGDVVKEDDGSLSLVGHIAPVTSVDFDRSGRYVVSLDSQGEARYWDLRLKGMVSIIVGSQNEGARVMAALHANPRAAFAGPDGVVRVRDSGFGEVQQADAGQGSAVWALAHDKARRFLFSGGEDGRVIRWELPGLKPTEIVDGGSPVRALSVSADGRRVLICRGDDATQLWDEIDSKARDFSVDGETRVCPAALSPDGERVAVTVGEGKRISIVSRDRRSGAVKVDPRLAASSILEFSPNGRLLAAMHEGSLEVDLADALTGQRRGTLVGHLGPVTALRFAPDGLSLATASQDHTVRIYRLPTAITAAAAVPAVAETRSAELPPEAFSASATPNPHVVGVVIGVERYSLPGLPAADFARRDASAVAEYLRARMGMMPENSKVLSDQSATKADIDKALGGWLRARADAESTVFIYFSGHGAPDVEAQRSYLMPYDGDPSYLPDTAVSVADLIRTAAALPSRDVRIILDSCFSGRGLRSVVKRGARPLVAVRDVDAVGSNTILITASAGDQIGASKIEAQHGLLTYYFVRGVLGEGSSAEDGLVRTTALYDFIRRHVESDARLQNVVQTPQIFPKEPLPRAAAGRTWGASSAARAGAQVSGSAP